MVRERNWGVDLANRPSPMTFTVPPSLKAGLCEPRAMAEPDCSSFTLCSWLGMRVNSTFEDIRLEAQADILLKDSRGFGLINGEFV